MRPPFEKDDDDRMSIDTDYSNYDATKHTPVFYGKMFKNVITDDDVQTNFDPSSSHPACFGHSFTTKPQKAPSPPPPLPPNRETCK